MSSARRYLVSGRVQGVFFRESTRRAAAPLGLDGWAINLPDGRVEVVASGSPDALAQLREYLQHGPRWARVDDVVEAAYEESVPAGFRTG